MLVGMMDRKGEMAIAGHKLMWSYNYEYFRPVSHVKNGMFNN